MWKTVFELKGRRVVRHLCHIDRLIHVMRQRALKLINIFNSVVLH